MNIQESVDIISVTPEVWTELKARLAKEAPGLGLRVYVEGGGCSGLRYGMMFDQKQPGDNVVERDGLTVLVDGESAGYLRGSILHYSNDLAGGGFKLENPNAQHSCGCGRSFHT
jgi:iron-sulfur cluster assembly accessory protein